MSDALTPFEHLMLADDRPAYPMTFFMRARVAGAVDGVRLRSAAVKALGRHPLLGARVRGGDARRRVGALYWEMPAGAVTPHIDLAAEGTPFRYPQATAALDLTSEPGVRIFVRTDAAGAWIWLQIHHAVADATGAAQFLEDVLIAYADDGALGNVRARVLEPALLANRAAFHVSRREERLRLIKDLGRIWRFFKQFPAPLAAAPGEPVPRTVTGAPGPAAVAHVLLPQQVEALRSEAHRHGATVNDLLLTDLFRTLAAWNTESGARPHIRLAMAINLRLAADRAMPAANVVSMCFLDRKGSEALGDPAALLAGVARETSDIKRYRLGLALIRVARLAGKLPGGLRRLMTPTGPWQCMSTAVLSNLGAPFAQSALPRDERGCLKAGPLTLEGLEFLPPIRPATRASFGVVSFRGELRLALHYDPRWFSPTAARSLMNQYVHVLEASMERAAAARLPFKERLAASISRKTSSPFRALPIGKNVGYGLPRRLGDLPQIEGGTAP